MSVIKIFNLRTALFDLANECSLTVAGITSDDKQAILASLDSLQKISVKLGLRVGLFIKDVIASPSCTGTSITTNTLAIQTVDVVNDLDFFTSVCNIGGVRFLCDACFADSLQRIEHIFGRSKAILVTSFDGFHHEVRELLANEVVDVSKFDWSLVKDRNLMATTWPRINM